MTIVGLDPSFSHTGIVYLRGNELIHTTFQLPPNPKKPFEQIVRDVRSVLDGLEAELSNINDDIEIWSECPPPTGQFASGLYALDTHLALHYTDKGVPFYRFYPTYVGHIHGKRSYAKSESVTLAKGYISELGWTYSRRIDQHQAEAIFFMLRGMARHNQLPSSFLKNHKVFTEVKEVLI